MARIINTLGGGAPGRLNQLMLIKSLVGTRKVKKVKVPKEAGAVSQNSVKLPKRI